jgi:Rrf2 family protein
VRVTAKVDYAVRAMVELADATEESPLKGERISAAQDIPLRFMENILTELRYGGLVRSRRGADGGYWPARPPEETTLAEIIRAVEGPLASVRGEPPDEVAFQGDAKPLQEVWIALRASMRDILETVTIADVASGRLPKQVRRIASDPAAWQAR